MTSLKGSPIFKGKSFNAKRVSGPEINSWDDTLTAGAILTGLSEEITLYQAVSVAVKTDQPGTLYMEQSPDGTNWDLTQDYQVAGNVSFEKIDYLTRRFYRTRFISSATTDHAYVRLQTSYADFSIGPQPGASSLKRLCWIDALDWVKGTLTNTEISGSGDASKIQLASLLQNDDDIGYENILNYTLSDGTKLDVAGGNARLKTLSGDSQAWPFTTPANYTYDGSKVEITGGVGRLLDLSPANSTFYANFETDEDGVWGDGDLTGTLTGGATVAGGKLNLIGSGRYCTWDANLNAESAQTGTFRVPITPNYSGNPAASQVFFNNSKAAGDNDNLIQVVHLTNGRIRIQFISDTGASIFMTDLLPAWNPISGVEYEFELNWDLTAGATRLFIAGTQLGSTETTTGTRDSNLALLRCGSNTPGTTLNQNFEVGSLLVFSAVQHTANYTPGASISDVRYDTSDPTIEPTSTLVFSAPLQVFFGTATVPAGTGVKHQVSSDGGTTKKWWDTSAWVPRTNTTTQIVPTAIATIAGTYDAGNLASIQTLDGSTYDVSESAGPAPNLRVDMDFTDIPQPPGQITIYVGYNGTLLHDIDVDIYNFQTTTWDTLGQIPDNFGIITQYNFTVTGTKSDYLDTNGDVDIRINHTSNGNAGHDIFIDYVYLLLDVNPLDTWYYDNESNTEVEINANIPTLAASGTFSWLAFLRSDGNLSTPEIDFIETFTSSTFSTDDNLYVDTTNASQVAPAPIAEWLTIDISEILPVGTFASGLISVDGRATWLGWTGSAWAVEAAPTLRANSTSITAIENNFASLPLGNGTLDFRLFLYSNDNTTSPAVSNINVISAQGIATAGTWASNQRTSGENNNDWDTVTWVGDIGSGGSITIQAKAANSILELNAASYGPALSNGDDAGVIGRYIQLLITLAGDGTEPTGVVELCVDFEDPPREILTP